MQLETKPFTELEDGEEFSPDNGVTWYICATPVVDMVAVYISNRRDEDAPTVRVEVPALVLVRPAS